MLQRKGPGCFRALLKIAKSGLMIELQKTDRVSEDTNQEQAKDDDDRGYILLQKSHAEEREKKRCRVVTLVVSR